MMVRGCAWAVILVLFYCVGSAQAYPEFQKYSQQKSKRIVNCAMCHAHPDGPDGAKFGQIGSLEPDELELLNFARRAFEPGTEIKSPILNSFGNAMVKQLGRTRIIYLKQHPEQLAAELGEKSDLDQDGIPDAMEFEQGTDPVNRYHGDPARLLLNNLDRYRFDIFMIVLATFFGIYTITMLLHGLEIVLRKKEEEKNDF